MKKIRVIVVDDSALVRSLVSEIINREKDMECVGTANDPLIARELIRELDPDVITLDIEMPKMDGIDFLGRLMRLRPMPVVMISTLTERGAEVTMRALELGAIDFVAKPRLGLVDGINELAGQIVDKVRVAASAHIRRLPSAGPVTSDESSAKPQRLSSTLIGRVSTEKMICIGASTGGTEAIKEVLTQLPADAPGVVITQHMPPGFTTSFAARLNNLCQITVQEAVNGGRILPGHAYIAPGGKQFSVSRSGANYLCVVEDGELVNRHRPSVEVLFKSVSKVVGRNAYGIMLTGMGADGAKAMKEMKDAGSYNYVQDEASCIVFGMPREAILCGAADEVLSLTAIAPALLKRLSGSTDRYRV
ncbi:protein-glutamate methylesterase/protein-glutamine glutaminase [Rhodoferax aquaticus]|uniref:Protein-glutamate methylesterase/protein-glutamine glutaminase n=1 Tax=Rhodoferax aquaticus TaxID=2527691 RepID=A0A515ETR4_9BURK|nr:chemotaxis response regulator protein-glutamate methylesterase [Rhodoferax aquaticus]QDL56052.1 chemotaxis response regulator protein-glutamate methylesterase [Rhodoferax aquaticus]